MKTLMIEAQEVFAALLRGNEPLHYSDAETVLAGGGKVMLTNFGARITEIKSVDELRSLTSIDGPKDHLRTEESMRNEAEQLVADALANAPFKVTFTVGTKAEDYRRIFNGVAKRRNARVYEDTPKFIRFGRDESAPCIIEYLESKDASSQRT